MSKQIMGKTKQSTYYCWACVKHKTILSWFPALLCTLKRLKTRCMVFMISGITWGKALHRGEDAICQCWRSSAASFGDHSCAAHILHFTVKVYHIASKSSFGDHSCLCRRAAHILHFIQWKYIIYQVYDPLVITSVPHTFYNKTHNAQ